MMRGNGFGAVTFHVLKATRFLWEMSESLKYPQTQKVKALPERKRPAERLLI
jgi:hypothetical protein